LISETSAFRWAGLAAPPSYVPVGPQANIVSNDFYKLLIYGYNKTNFLGWLLWQMNGENPTSFIERQINFKNFLICICIYSGNKILGNGLS